MRVFMRVDASDDPRLGHGCSYAHIDIVSFANNEG